MTINATLDTIEQMDDIVEPTDDLLSQASVVAFCGACFSDKVCKLTQSNELLESGLSAPVVRTEPKDGKLVVEVDVWPRQLPKATDEKKTLFLKAANVAREALSFASAPSSWAELEKWTRIEFLDVDAAMKSRPAKAVVAIYENGQLALL